MAENNSKTRKLLGALALTAALTVLPAKAQEPPREPQRLEEMAPTEQLEEKIEATTPKRGLTASSGYNAFQVGMIDDEPRFRTYLNIGLEKDGVHLRLHGMDEAGPGYAFGRNSLRIGADRMPIELIYATRSGGKSIQETQQLDEAYGVRVDLRKIPGINYGFADLLQHTGAGSTKYEGKEAVIFLGKKIGQGGLEMTLSFKEGGNRYIEVEGLTPVIGGHLRGYARAELPGMNFNSPSIILGLQMQQ